MPPRVRPPLHRGPATSANGSDAGFTVLECLVSFVILAVISAAAVAAVVNATITSTNSTNRIVAANLAQSDQNAAQALRYPSYPAAIAAKAVKVGSDTYTVTRGVVGTACPPTPNYATTLASNQYMIVMTTVTWPPGGVTHRVIMSQEFAC